MILPQAKPVGWSNPLKNPLRPLSEVAYSVQAFDWSSGKETETTQDIPSEKNAPCSLPSSFLPYTLHIRRPKSVGFRVLLLVIMQGRAITRRRCDATNYGPVSTAPSFICRAVGRSAGLLQCCLGNDVWRRRHGEPFCFVSFLGTEL